MNVTNNLKSVLFITGIIISVFLISACNGKKDETDNKGNKVLTERIQYDVLIKTPDPDFDWWVQNIEGSKRESFIKTFLKLATDGKVKAYDYFNNPLTTQQVKNIDKRVDTITVPDPKDPSKNKDTIVKTDLDIQRITKIRFLEEWSLDEKKMSFDKKVVGLMLMKENYDENAQLRGYSPLFWIYFDDSYPAKMK
ncbi:MAG: hypothetical protein ABR968_05910 [Bacteroidales bacterium]|jgi:hypothetical protein